MRTLPDGRGCGVTWGNDMYGRLQSLYIELFDAPAFGGGGASAGKVVLCDWCLGDFVHFDFDAVLEVCSSVSLNALLLHDLSGSTLVEQVLRLRACYECVVTLARAQLVSSSPSCIARHIL